MTIGFSRLIPALVLFGSLPLSGAVDLDFEKENTMLECRTGAKERIVQLEKPLSGPFTLLIRLPFQTTPSSNQCLSGSRRRPSAAFPCRISPWA